VFILLISATLTAYVNVKKLNENSSV